LENKVILTADSTCDLTTELLQKYKVHTIPLHINLGGSSYLDLLDITPDDIYKNFGETGTLPKTAAVNTQEYINALKPYIDKGYEVVHVNLGSALSASYQNCCNAAKQLGGIYPVDSCNLSTGSGLLVIQAAQLISQGCSAKETAEKTQSMAHNSHGSFIVDRLEYLRAGGRCSAVAVLGANILGIKPCIEVDNTNGSMSVGKKYRGRLTKVLTTYVEEQLNRYNDIDTSRVFITHAGISQDMVDHVYNILSKKHIFDEILVTRASCTISSHCGPDTLGILFMTK